jgi:hypothetical protein
MMYESLNKQQVYSLRHAMILFFIVFSKVSSLAGDKATWKGTFW